MCLRSSLEDLVLKQRPVPPSFSQNTILCSIFFASITNFTISYHHKLQHCSKFVTYLGTNPNTGYQIYLLIMTCLPIHVSLFPFVSGFPLCFNATGSCHRKQNNRRLESSPFFYNIKYRTCSCFNVFVSLSLRKKFSTLCCFSYSTIVRYVPPVSRCLGFIPKRDLCELHMAKLQVVDVQEGSMLVCRFCFDAVCLYMCVRENLNLGLYFQWN